MNHIMGKALVFFNWSFSCHPVIFAFIMSVQKLSCLQKMSDAGENVKSVNKRHDRQLLPAHLSLVNRDMSNGIQVLQNYSKLLSLQQNYVILSIKKYFEMRLKRRTNFLFSLCFAMAAWQWFFILLLISIKSGGTFFMWHLVFSLIFVIAASIANRSSLFEETLNTFWRSAFGIRNKQQNG